MGDAMASEKGDISSRDVMDIGLGDAGGRQDGASNVEGTGDAKKGAGDTTGAGDAASTCNTGSWVMALASVGSWFASVEGSRLASAC
ncbi:unnamed protein product [Ilex paraguariensis]|uniref:Uncharacterized protein n=1 Tax=Ilex paraguariensis TaxID=185542 RepID=A0ABC8UL74_9AQUA